MPRKFTSPVKFPADYVFPDGWATVVAPLPDGLGYVGIVHLSDGSEHGQLWNDTGHDPDDQGFYDLFDIPVRVRRYRPFVNHNIMKGTHIVTCNEDGTDPTVRWEPKL